MELLWTIVYKILLPLAVVIGLAILAWFLKKALRVALELKYGGSAGPIWLLSALAIGAVVLVLAIRALWSNSTWVDLFTWRWITQKLASYVGLTLNLDLDFPTSAFWLGGIIIIVTLLYLGLTVLFIRLIGPPAVGKQKTGVQPRKHGRPPSSAAASAQEPEMGLLVAADSALSAGSIQWIYKNVGYWKDPRPGSEPRYRLWLEPLHKTMAWLKWIALPIVAFGEVSALAWIVAALFHDAIKQILAIPPPPSEEEEKEEEEPEPIEEDPDVAESALISKIAQELGGSGLCIRPIGSSSPSEPDFSTQPWPDQSGGSLWASVLEGQKGSSQGFQLFTHQYEAVKQVLSREDVLLDTLPGSGKRTVIDLVSSFIALCRSGSILIIVPDEKSAVERVSKLREMGQKDRWHWSVSVHNLVSDGISGLDPLVEQPEIVVGTVDALETHFMAVSGHWDQFLAGLALIVIQDIDEHFGARSASLGSLCRRLLLLSGDMGAKPTIFATATSLFKGTIRLAEEVTSRSLKSIRDASNGAPRPSQAIYLASGGPDLVKQLTKIIETSGWVRHDKGMTRMSTISTARSSMIQSLDRSMIHSLGGVSTATRVLVFHVLEPKNPLTATLCHPNKTGELMPTWVFRTPLLPNGWGNPASSAQALGRSLGERECSRKDLETNHGSKATNHELEILSQKDLLAERESAQPDENSGLPTPVKLFRLSDPTRVRIASASTVVTSDPFDLKESSTGETLLSIDKVRSQVALYPGRVFLSKGRRYRVIEESGKLLAEPETDQVWTLPRRKATVELQGWSPQQVKLGKGAVIESGTGDIAYRVEVLGVRRFDIAGELSDERSFENPRKAAYPAHAVVVRFPPFDGLKIDGGTIHCLVHLVRCSLPLVLRSEASDIDVAQISDDERGVPGLAIIDLHPFGAGFTEALKISSLKDVFRVSLDLIKEQPDLADLSYCLSPEGSLKDPDLATCEELLKGLTKSSR